jgi:hypothetical protein
MKNYRPISLISIIGKVMERCVYKHIYNFLLENRIISFNQSGFTPGDSADMLNNLHSGYFNIGAASRKSRGLIQSGPVLQLCPYHNTDQVDNLLMFY